MDRWFNLFLFTQLHFMYLGNIAFAPWLQLNRITQRLNRFKQLLNHFDALWLLLNRITYIMNRFNYESYHFLFETIDQTLWHSLNRFNLALNRINLLLGFLSRFIFHLTRFILHHIFPSLSFVLYGLNRFIY